MITLGKYLSTYHSVMGDMFAFLGIAFALIVHLAPFGIAILLIFSKGKILLGILFPIIWWITLSFSFAILPVWWIIGIFNYGFVYSTSWCLTLLAFFSLPDIFFWLATNQMRKAEQIEQYNSRKEEDKRSDTREINWKDI